mmetsp:Transcript_3130/g.5466  ORF Transcript_3130/g.5466 Transcript_3130/m.5466 type:complete len:93 (-) Transcript_3130:708-986(-)
MHKQNEIHMIRTLSTIFSPSFSFLPIQIPAHSMYTCTCRVAPVTMHMPTWIPMGMERHNIQPTRNTDFMHWSLPVNLHTMQQNTMCQVVAQP